MHMIEQDAASAAAYPDPGTDINSPWLWWMRRVLLPASDAGQQINIDVRARRRFRSAFILFSPQGEPSRPLLSIL